MIILRYENNFIVDIIFVEEEPMTKTKRFVYEISSDGFEEMPKGSHQFVSYKKAKILKTHIFLTEDLKNYWRLATKEEKQKQYELHNKPKIKNHKLKVIFIHGNDTMRWSYCWTPWLKKELEKLNVEVIFETFPDSILARKKYWISFLKDYLKTDEKTLLIGHSSGAVCTMRYAQKNKIYGSILIAPCYTDLNLEEEKISGWYDDKWEWSKIKENQNYIGLLYSKNDEAIPEKEFIHIKNKLNPNKVIEFEKNGHFIKQNEFIEVVDIVKEILNNIN